MNSFHQSRGRILFEAFCALGISASLAGAWLQTEASALLPAAVLSLLFALVRTSDMSEREPASDAVLQEEPTPALEAVAEPEPAKPAAAKPKASRSKAPPKSPVRRAKASKEPVVAESPAPEMPVDEMPSAPLEPLFEPQPFVRQQHAVFGRKAGARFG